MRKKIHSNLSKKKINDKTKKKVVSKKNKLQIKGQKVRNIQKLNQKLTKKNLKDKKDFDFKSKLTRKNITYFILFLVDIILVIYVARKNVVNYVNIFEQKIFVSDTKNLLVGRNYITLVITGFFYLYTCIVNRFFLQEKNTKKFLIGFFFALLILNCFLFFLFTKRIY